jgi:hypothetical protein
MKKLTLLVGCVLALGLTSAYAGDKCGGGGCKGKDKGKDTTEERV